MIGFEDELRLGWCLLLNGISAGAAWRLGRREAASLSQQICDAMLIWFLQQYLSVAIPGLLHVLNAFTMSLTAVLLALATWLLAGRLEPPPSLENSARGRDGALAVFLLTIGYLAAFVFDQRWLPPMATDSLVYQLPTAVHWLRTGTLALFPCWYWNPANTYAPQCATCAMVWWTAPLKCDVFSRFVQAPALVWIFCLTYSLARTLVRDNAKTTLTPGAAWVEGLSNRLVPALLASCVVLSRPLFSEAAFAKDDLYLTAFVTCAILACADANLRDRYGPWRLGTALGLVLASKYTVLMICPIFLFLLEAPRRARWGWRAYLIAIGAAVVLAAPWYLRNLLLFANPLYPVDVRLAGRLIFPGLFTTEPDRQLRHAAGIRRMLSETYHSLPTPLLWPIVAMWVIASVAAGRSLLRDPLRRAVTLGAAMVLALFLIASPHHEFRYVFPLLPLVIASAILCSTLPKLSEAALIGGGATLAIIALLTSFDARVLGGVLEMALAAALLAAAGLAMKRLASRWPALAPAGLTVAIVVFAGWVYIDWHATLNRYREACLPAWSIGYEAEAPVWQFVREQLPPDSPIAFANTQLVYPFYGFTYDRPAAYAPVRRDLRDFVHLPRLGQTVPGDLIVQRETAVINTDPDEATWLANLAAMHAKYLVVFHHPTAVGLSDQPPELSLARRESERFTLVQHFQAADIFEVRR